MQLSSETATSMSSNKSKTSDLTIILNSSDNECIPIPFHVAEISNLVKNIIEEEEEEEEGSNGDCDNDDERVDNSKVVTIDLPNVNSNILRKIVKFMKHYYVEPLDPISYPFKGSTLSDVITQEWYISFINSMESQNLFEIISGANYMDIEPLFNLGCLVTSTMIMDKTAEEIRAFLKIDKLSATEELKAREEHEWMFS